MGLPLRYGCEWCDKRDRQFALECNGSITATAKTSATESFTYTLSDGAGGIDTEQ